MELTLQMLISAVDKDPEALIKRMNIKNNAILINQKPSGGEFSYREFPSGDGLIKVYEMPERGVGLSRNNALMRADADICLFCDDDIIYEDDAPKRILDEFRAHPEADMLLFNVSVSPERRTYHNESYERVKLHNCGRYPSYSFAIKRQLLHEKNLYFSLLFGGGARYSNGEDSLFIRDCIRSGLKVYKTPVSIGREEAEGSTWFSGYHEKFFYDRGVLYHFLYGPLAVPIALRFLLKHRKLMCRTIPWPRAFFIMLKGIRRVEK